MVCSMQSVHFIFRFSAPPFIGPLAPLAHWVRFKFIRTFAK